MSKDWLEKLEIHMPPRIEQAVKDADKAINDYALRVRLSRWHPISTAPCNQELELRIGQVGELLPLEFPCLKTNLGQWINVDLGSEIKIQPAEWRIWQHSKSPQPHYSKIKPSDRSPLFHQELVSTKNSGTNQESR